MRHLLDAVVAVANEPDLAAVLQRITDTAALLLDSHYAVAKTPEQPGEGSRVFASRIDETSPIDRDGRPPGSGLRSTIRVRDKVLGTLYVADKPGARFNEQDEQVLVALATAAGLAIENFGLLEGARLRERWLRASGEVTTTLLSGTEPHAVLVVVAERARDIANAALALIALPSEGGVLRIEVAEGQNADAYRDSDLSVLSSAAGKAFTTARSVTVSSLPPRDGLLVRAGQEGLGAVTAVPLEAVGLVRGVLVVAQEAGGSEFTDVEVRMLHGFAAQAAVALELAERRRDAERLSLYEDRDRIARDLHDLVIQRLFAAGMALESMSHLVGDTEASQRMHQVVDDLDMTIKEIRSAIYDLQSPVEVTNTTGLRARLNRIAVATADVLGFVPSLQLDGPVDSGVPPELGDDVVAVVREALTNVARHAEATQVRVSVAVTSDRLVVNVRDDGVGLSNVGHRSGLTNLEERAAARGGAFSALAVDEGGTELTWRVPLVDAEHH
jgi:signal transduction histidine kinase